MVGQMQLLLPPAYCEAFEPMCMNAPRTSFKDVREIIEEDSGKKLEDIFECIHYVANNLVDRF